MNYSIEVLTNEKFAEFGKTVADLSAKKKKLKEEFKKVYDKFNAEMKAFDENILNSQKEFEKWREKFETSATDS